MKFGVFLLVLNLTEGNLDEELVELGLVAIDQVVEILAGLELVEQKGVVFEERWEVGL